VPPRRRLANNGPPRSLFGASTTFNTLTPGTLTALDEENIESGQVIVTDSDGDPAFRQGLFVP
jgi:hypothetical protein